MNKAREKLIKFGLEKEYLDWKTNLPVSLDQLHVGSRFIVTKGKLKGTKGKIVRSQSMKTEYVTDINTEEGYEIIITKNCLPLIKLI